MGEDKDKPEDQKLPSTRTKRDLAGYATKSRKKGVTSPKRGRVVRVAKHFRKSKSTKRIRIQRELSGKELVRKIMREIYASIRRKEEKN